jgi:predicted MPP superfamily phosphohydrolase
MLLVVFAGSIVYNVFDNQRFIVVQQEIAIERLPESFDGFKILQISDLHGRTFGENQANLINAINSLDYDMIAFTGDMNASTKKDDSLNNSQAILDLLDGIENKESMFWVDGNTGPYAMESYGGTKTGELTDIGKVLQAKGCKILVLPYAITRGNDKIWITPEMPEIGFEEAYRGRETDNCILSVNREAHAPFQEIHGNHEVKILLIHTPKQINLTAEQLKQYGAYLDYDLILAGHYHGGQWRLPWIGALYIPSPTTGINNSGYFPSQIAVKGWNYYGNIPQYVSAGLGASDHTLFAGFRLFNTPEINLITLTGR